MLRVEVFKQKVQGESISTCTCQQELTWSSEIKCKPSFAIPKTNTYKYLHGRVCVCVRTQGARTEHQYMCFSTIELTWSSEIKCKPSFAISFLTSMHIRVCIQVCTSVCIFKQKVQGKSISTWISQQANLPEVQRSSVNHHCTKTNAYVYMHASVRVFSNKRCKEKSISSWISQQVNLPEIQRSSVNHHCNIFAPKQTHIYIYADKCRQACV